jgi:hypothetical protein
MPPVLHASSKPNSFFYSCHNQTQTLPALACPPTKSPLLHTPQTLGAMAASQTGIVTTSSPAANNKRAATANDGGGDNSVDQEKKCGSSSSSSTIARRTLPKWNTRAPLPLSLSSPPNPSLSLSLCHMHRHTSHPRAPDAPPRSLASVGATQARGSNHPSRSASGSHVGRGDGLQRRVAGGGRRVQKSGHNEHDD